MFLSGLVAACGPDAAETVQNVLVPIKGAGAAYGARDPLSCSSTAAPKSGPITAGYARQYVICDLEQGDTGDQFWLLEHVKVEVGKGVVPTGTYYIPRADQDPNAKDYAIRGSLDRYLCSKQNKGVMIGNELQFNNIGHNCTVWHESHATGDCYRTTFGDWKCYMHGD
ncbi:MAG: hypothetical protein KGO02_01210, partial [Alphaproteobacteria bacterium]|nr:hypothetical protein [Alphaproteobacteria bacterium]